MTHHMWKFGGLIISRGRAPSIPPKPGLVPTGLVVFEYLALSFSMTLCKVAVDPSLLYGLGSTAHVDFQVEAR